MSKTAENVDWKYVLGIKPCDLHFTVPFTFTDSNAKIKIERNKEDEMETRQIHEVYAEAIDEKGNVLAFIGPNHLIAAGKEHAKSLYIRMNAKWIDEQESLDRVVRVWATREV